MNKFPLYSQISTKMSMHDLKALRCSPNNFHMLRVQYIYSPLFKNIFLRHCITFNMLTMFISLALIFLEASSVTIDIEDIDLQAANISWSSLNQSVYTLTIVNSRNIAQPQILQLHHPYYAFSAPEGAPPCEVYSFSVAANYDIVGATYTGVGCSVSSPEISRMLPSLPDINPLRSSIKFLLEKHSTGIILTTSFAVHAYSIFQCLL